MLSEADHIQSLNPSIPHAAVLQLYPCSKLGHDAPVHPASGIHATDARRVRRCRVTGARVGPRRRMSGASAGPAMARYWRVGVAP